MLRLVMFPFNYGMVLTPIGFATASDKHQSEEQNEGAQIR
jgi:hypothetical protein